MDIKFTDNITENLLDTLSPSLAKANDIRVGVAFARYSGFSLIEDDVKECLKNGGKAEFVVGLDFRTTEPKVLKILHAMEKRGSKIGLFCFSDPSISDRPVYHPKVYLIRKRQGFVISIGSSNLTAGGLKGNVEVNAIIRARAEEEVVSDIYGIYNRLKFRKSRFAPDLAYIDEYEEAYELVRKRSLEALKKKSTRGKIERLRKREESLPRPKAAGAELFGWQKLIYERLPEGIFSTNHMYRYEEEFRTVYPQNTYIKAKIRQILQQLRDIGLLRHVSESKWSKV